MNYTKEQLLNVQFHTGAREPIVFLESGYKDVLILKAVDRLEQAGNQWDLKDINENLRTNWKLLTQINKDAKEDSGGSCSYYSVDIKHPTSEQNLSKGVVYTAECNDIIEVLNMTYAEANMFKEIWRSAAARTLGKLKAGHSEVRGAEKIEFFAKRNTIQKAAK